MNDDDFLDSFPKANKKTTGFKQAVDVTREETSKASGRKGKFSMHGSQAQTTVRMDPQLLEEILAWTKELGLKQNEMFAWLLGRGLRALKEGERPETEVVEVRRVKRP